MESTTSRKNNASTETGFGGKTPRTKAPQRFPHDKIIDMQVHRVNHQYPGLSEIFSCAFRTPTFRCVGIVEHLHNKIFRDFPLSLSSELDDTRKYGNSFHKLIPSNLKGTSWMFQSKYEIHIEILDRKIKITVINPDQDSNHTYLRLEMINPNVYDGEELNQLTNVSLMYDIIHEDDFVLLELFPIISLCLFTCRPIEMPNYDKAHPIENPLREDFTYR